MWTVTTEAKFAAAHRIEQHPGLCRNLHGHNYRLVVSVIGQTLDSKQMLIDFGDVQSVLKDLMTEWDHVYLNEKLNTPNVTAELLAYQAYQYLRARFPREVRLVVEVWETDKSRASYTEP